MTDTNTLNILKWPSKMPSKIQTYLKAAANESAARPYLTWVHASNGYLYSADGARVHIMRTGAADVGSIQLPKSIPCEGTSRVWDVISPFIAETRISATVNTGRFIEQSHVMTQLKPKRFGWHQVSIWLDDQVMALIPRVRTGRVSPTVHLLKRGDEPEGLNASIDIRYIRSALWCFDPQKPLQITIPYNLSEPFRFQQEDFISLIMPMME